jgi:D-tyrosyl-tRNA(Tyr) deacylase
MRALLQRVSSASVSVADDEIGSIGCGLLVLLGVVPADDEHIARRLAEKTVELRIFPGVAKPMNRSVEDVGGEVLVVPQFTLAADTRRGRRPSFTGAAPPEQARELYETYARAIEQRLGHVAMGEFGADLQVALVNDGPVTILLDTDA